TRRSGCSRSWPTSMPTSRTASPERKSSASPPLSAPRPIPPMSELRIVDAGARSHLPFSPGIIAGDFMYVSGQASVDTETGAIITDSFEGEMRRSLANLKAILEAGGLGLDHVINVKSYVA